MGYAFGSTTTGTAGHYNDLQRRQEEERRRQLGTGFMPPSAPVLGGPTPLSLGVQVGRPNAVPMLPAAGGRGVNLGTTSVAEGGGFAPHFGGGGGAPRLGGGSPSFEMGPRTQMPFSSDRDGSTVAPVNEGAGQFHGLAPFDAQFNGEYARPKLTSWGQEWGEASKPAPPQQLPPTELLRRADGGPVPHGMPFIAGDPQKDKKPNPELIVPGPQGMQVIPLKNIPKMRKESDGTSLKPPMHGLEEFYHNNPTTPSAASQEVTKLMMHPELKLPIRIPIPKYAYGTGTLDPTRFNMGNEYIPGFVPQLDTGGAFGGVAPLPNGDGLEARDASGNVVGFSTGFQPQAPPPLVPHGTADTMPASVPKMHGIETEEQYQARRLSMNPQQIEVGFTPRPPLHGFTDADALRGGGKSKEERAFASMERDVMRAAKGNPYVAQRMLAAKAAGEAAQAQAEFERQKHDDLLTHQNAETERKRMAAAGLVSTGQPGQPMLKTVGAQRLESDAANREITNKRADEQLGISKSQLELQQEQARMAQEKTQRELNPQGSVVPIPGTNLGTAFVNGHQAARVPTLEQTSPGIAPFQVGNMPMPGSPPQFKPMVPPVKDPDPTGVKATKDHLSAIDKVTALLDKENLRETPDPGRVAMYQRWLKQHSDAYDEGVGFTPPPAAGMGDAKVSGSSAASAFINSITKKK